MGLGSSWPVRRGRSRLGRRFVDKDLEPHGRAQPRRSSAASASCYDDVVGGVRQIADPLAGVSEELRDPHAASSEESITASSFP
jgi:hypothetical protein